MKLERLPGVDRPPGKIDIPSAWRGEEIGANPDRWLKLLGAADIAELLADSLAPAIPAGRQLTVLQ